jgi:hypothetical protein
MTATGSHGQHRRSPLMTKAREPTDRGVHGPGGAGRQDGPAASGKQSLAARAPGRVMSSLLLTPDDELEGFRRACLGGESQVTARHLILARQLLKEIGRALADDDAELWRRLTAAHDIVTGETSAAAPARPSEPEPRLAVGLPRTPPGVAPAPPELLASLAPAQGLNRQGMPAAPRAPEAPEPAAPMPLPPAVARWEAVLRSRPEPGPEGPRPAPATVNVEEGARPAGAGSALPDGALPFAKGARPAPPPLGLARPPRAALDLPGSSEETLPATSLSAEERAKLDALPFHQEAAEHPGQAQAAPLGKVDPAAMVTTADETTRMPRATPQTATVALGDGDQLRAALGIGAGLPFALGAQPETRAAPRVAPRPPPPAEALDAEDCTVAQAPAPRHQARLEAPGETDTRRVALPRANLPPRLEAMPLEQFAAMCAECSFFPDHVQQIQLRYGIASPLERSALDELWRQRMALDPSLHTRWLELCGRLTRMLRSNPPR